MTEVEKLYKNTGVEKKVMCEWTCKDSETCNLNCEHYQSRELYYPPFTEKKQLEIVKFLLNKSVYYDTYGDREYWFHLSDEIENSKYRDFDEAIAECINKMWKDLRDYEKVQIKEILSE